VLVALVGLSLGDYQDCTYLSSDGLYQYDLNPLFGAFSFVSRDDNTAVALSFSICGPLSAILPSIRCEEDSAACFFPSIDDAQVDAINIGNWQDTLFSDSELGSAQGVELVYSPSSNLCDSTGKKFKTSIKLQCDPTSEFLITIIESPANCDTIISINSSYACPAYQEIPQFSGSNVVRVNPFSTLFVAAILCCCLCCCMRCLRRNRRCAMKSRQEQQQRATEIEMTNTALQQQPQQSEVTQPLMIPVPPEYLQYLQQSAYVPQYSFVQPQAEQQTNQQVAEQNLMDEQYARALQAQFNME